MKWFRDLVEELVQCEVVAMELENEVVNECEGVAEIQGGLQQARWTGEGEGAVRGARGEGVQFSLPVEEEEGPCWGLERG